MSDTTPQFTSRRERRIAELEAQAQAEAASVSPAAPEQPAQWQPAVPTQPVYEQPAQPVYAQPVAAVPTFEQPVAAPVYAQPAPVAPLPTFEQPVAAPVQPVYEQPAPATPVYEQPAPAAPLPTFDEIIAEPTTPATTSQQDADAALAARMFAAPAAASAPVQPVVAAPAAPAGDAAAFFTSSATAEETPAAPAGETSSFAPPPPPRPVAVEPEPEPTKGVNLWAAISMTAVVASAALMFTPPVADFAPYISYLAVPLAIVAILLPGFKRLQSIVAIVLALGLGGYNGYTQFLAAPAESTTRTAPPELVRVTASGEGTAAVSWVAVDSGTTLNNALPDAALPFTNAFPITDLTTAKITVTVTNPTAGCEISLPGYAPIVGTAVEGVAECVFDGATAVPEPEPVEEPVEEG